MASADGSGQESLVPFWKMMDPSMKRVLEKIAKGLCYLDEGTPVPSDFEVSVIYNREPERLIDDLLGGLERVDVGDGPDVVAYWRARTQDGTKASITWVVFYRQIAFVLVCMPEETMHLERDGEVGMSPELPH